MSIKYSPPVGTILICDYSTNAVPPEMIKRRPVIVLSVVSSRLCVVVPCSTAAPTPVEPWHYLLATPKPLPRPYSELEHWVKCDMLFTASFDRLYFPFDGKDRNGKRNYDIRSISANDLANIKICVKAALHIG